MSMGVRKIENAVKVITYFERPSRHTPDGKMIIIVGEEHIVYYGSLPYDDIPIVQIICKEVAGQFFGKSIIEELIPLQRAYNGCENRIHEYIKRVAIQSYMVEEGSVDEDDFEQNAAIPGAILSYKKGFALPATVKNGDLPRTILDEKAGLIRDMEYVAGVSQLMVNSRLPSGVTSGRAIENLRDIDNTRLSLTGDYIRNGVKNVGKMWLHIYKRYANTYRIINYLGSNEIGKSIVCTNEDINSYDIEFDTENELLFSEDMQRERFIELFKMGFFADSTGQIPEQVKRKAIEYMKMGNYTDIMSIDTLQTQAAQRENVFFENGVIPEISDIDNHEIHIDEHTRYCLQMKYQILKMKKPEFAGLMLQHIQVHQRITETNQKQRLLEAQALQRS